MTDNERDTHFQGFARLLYEDWLDTCGGHIDFDSDNALDRQEFEAFIARRAYDLAVHVLANHWAYPTEAIYTIPDLTEFPPKERYEND